MSNGVSRWQEQPPSRSRGSRGPRFHAGTVFSVHLNPLRDGSNFGSRVGAIARCPMDSATKKPKLPEAGKHCDSVQGHTLIGGTIVLKLGCTTCATASGVPEAPSLSSVGPRIGIGSRRST